MMTHPIFLNNPQNTVQYFNLNHDPHHHHGQDQPPLQLPIPPFCPTVVLSSATTLQLDQGLISSSDDQSQPFSDQHQGSKNNGIFHDQVNHDPFIFKRQEDHQDLIINPNNTKKGSSLRWMSSKMRMMRKMINNSNRPAKTDHSRIGSRIINNNNSNNPPDQLGINNNVIRTCSDCNTTRTPLWRSGPRGPKTLCNACGIRQRKARKAAMEAASYISSTEAASSLTSSAKTTIKLLTKKGKKKSRASCVPQKSNKKQSNDQTAAASGADSDPNSISTTSSSSSKHQQLLFEEFAVNLLRENAAFHRMFPQDEEEGALLLMALSYGLIQS